MFTDFTAVRHSEKNPIRPDLRQHLPPSIALYGLLDLSRQSPHYPKEAKALICHVKEVHPFLVDFSSRIGDIFAANGLVPVISPMDDPLKVSIMRTRFIPSDVPNLKPSLRKLQPLRSPVFDASDLHAKYRDHPWTTEFPLERMCISEYCLRDVWKRGKFVRTAFKDIVSVPLPGVSQDVVGVEDPDEDYVKRQYIKTPLAPHQIPSTPPS